MASEHIWTTRVIGGLRLGSSTALGSFLLMLPLVAASAASTFSLDISRHNTVATTNQQADSILDDASQVLKVDDDGVPGILDVPCDVTLNRSGSVSVFSTNAPATINSDSQLEKVFAEPAFIKVVKAINWCDGAGSVDGCTTNNSRTMIVVARAPGPETAVLWAHEFGHATGLNHRAGDRLVMNPTFDGTYRFINDTECTSYLKGPPATLVASSDRKAVSSAQEQSKVPLLEMAKRSFTNRVPYALFANGDAAELPALAPLLFDFSYQHQWKNIASILGILGNKTHLELLIKFVEADLVGADSAASYRAKTSALLAMGYYLNRTGDSRAAGYLLSATNPGFWETMNAPWLGFESEERRTQINQLQEVSLIALALSGRDEVAPLLAMALNSRLTLETSERTAFSRQISDTHAKVKSGGLLGYYAQR